MSEGTARQRTRKLSKVTCRVCREQLNFQSYPDHLGIVEEALELYWTKAKRVGERGGPWIRKSENVIPYTVSQAVDTIVSKQPEVDFMM